MKLRTTMILPPKLMAAAQKAIGARTKTEAVIRSLELAIHRKKAEQLIALFGRLPLKMDLNKSRQRTA
jgi:hypothetical protein